MFERQSLMLFLSKGICAASLRSPEERSVSKDVSKGALVLPINRVLRDVLPAGRTPQERGYGSSNNDIACPLRNDDIRHACLTVLSPHRGIVGASFLGRTVPLQLGGSRERRFGGLGKI